MIPPPKPPETGHTIVLPHVKDDTDTHYAARWLLQQGAKSVTMLGALGGARMEHTLANLATGLYLARSARLWMSAASCIICCPAAR